MICYMDLDQNWVVAHNHGLESTKSEILPSNLDFRSGKIAIRIQVLDKFDYQMICYLDLHENLVVAYNHGLEYTESEIHHQILISAHE